MRAGAHLTPRRSRLLEGVGDPLDDMRRHLDEPFVDIDQVPAKRTGVGDTGDVITTLVLALVAAT